MKTKIIGLSLLLATNLLAYSKVKDEKSIIDTTHTKVVETLNNNVEVLPESMQRQAKKLIDDIDKDSTNIKFVLGYQYFMSTAFDVGKFNRQDHIFDGSGTSNHFGTVGIKLFPNTWKINLEYNGLIKESWQDPEVPELSDSDFRGREKKVREEYFNFYFKPISAKFGDIGFGYSYSRTNQLMTIQNEHNHDGTNGGQLVDIENDGQNINNTIKSLVLNDDQFYGFSTKMDRLNITYTLPNMKYIPNGLGLIYSKEKSNTPIALTNNKMALHPNIDSTSIGFGIFKTMDDLKDGFSIKRLSIENVKYDFSYYNFNTEKNGNGNGTRETKTVELIYKNTFNKLKNKSFFISLFSEDTIWDSEVNEQFAVKTSVGFIF